MSADPVQPVNWDARLSRSADVLYTEVVTLPVLCDARDRSVRALTPDSVSLWARLDGGTLRDAVGPSAEDWTDDDRRSFIEVVRRFKATGLVEDAPVHGAPPVLPSLDDVPPAVSSVRLRAHLEQDVLALGGTAEEGSVEVEVTVASPPSAVVLPDDVLVANDAPDEVRALAGWVRAVVDREELQRPGVLDALAGLAERVPVVGAGPVPTG